MLRTYLTATVTVAALSLAGGVAAQPASVPAPPPDAVPTPMPSTIPATRPAGTQPETAQPAEARGNVDPAGREILQALEQAGDRYRALRADVVYDEVDPLLGDRQVRKGWVAYRAAAESDGDERPAQFRVTFTTLRQGDGPPIAAEVDYAFDGKWLTIRKHRVKQLHRRQVVAEGEQIEPMKLGEGPLPIPFGQEADEVLKHFSVHVLPVTDPALEGTDHLQLLPRTEQRAGLDTEAVELWVDRGTHLPVRMSTVQTDGKRLTATFTDIDTDADLEDATFHIPKPAGPGWQLHVEPLTPEGTSRP